MNNITNDSLKQLSEKLTTYDPSTVEYGCCRLEILDMAVTLQTQLLEQLSSAQSFELTALKKTTAQAKHMVDSWVQLPIERLNQAELAHVEHLVLLAQTQLLRQYIE